jgi:hypothetical protein
MSLPRMGERQKPFRSDTDFRVLHIFGRGLRSNLEVVNVDKYELFWDYRRFSELISYDGSIGYALPVDWPQHCAIPR